MIFAPLTNKCEWATELGNCNLIYGLGGADKDKALKEQSVMYQFVHYAKLGGSKLYGTIPFGQVSYEEKLDFSIGIESCYITPQLQERMDAFKNLSQLVIVGSTGTGTYEEVMDTLRTNPLTHIIIMNDDGGNSPLVEFLNENKDKYPNIAIANNREEFKKAVDNFKGNFRKFNVSDNVSVAVGVTIQKEPLMVNSQTLFNRNKAELKKEQSLQSSGILTNALK